ncbi:MAG TPA: FtsX-like permease family protein, partial [Thermomicrobiaceae bacterium]|nr:FtsX-like permease family protein [Thermomicrobiaceae bacterium]
LRYAQLGSYTPPPIPPGRPKLAPITPNDVVTRLTAIIEDGSGVLRSFDLGVLTNDGQPHSVILPLADQLTKSELARPSGPLQLVQLQLSVYPPGGPDFSGTLKLTQLAVSNQLQGNQWASLPLTGTKGAFAPGPPDATGNVPPGVPRITLSAAPAGQLAAAIVTGSGQTASPSVPIAFTLRPASGSLPAAIPVLVNDAFLHQLGLQPGGTFPLQASGGTVNATVAGTFSSFPTIDPSQLVVVADYGTFDAMELFQQQSNPSDPDERWLAVDSGRSSKAAASLQAAPFSSPTVTSLVEQRQALQTDPVALGTIGALSLGFIAALVFAGIGFAVSAAVSVHERLGEFATLRALGLSPRQLAGWLMLEQGILIGLSLLGGTIVGLGLSWLILPLITVTQAGAQVVPSLLVVVPWLRLIGMEAIIVVLLATVVGVAAMLLRRIGIGQVLRMGVE